MVTAPARKTPRLSRRCASQPPSRLPMAALNARPAPTTPRNHGSACRSARPRVTANTTTNVAKSVSPETRYRIGLSRVAGTFILVSLSALCPPGRASRLHLLLSIQPTIPSTFPPPAATMNRILPRATEEPMTARAPTMKRDPACILATCCVPWDDQGRFAEAIFRRGVRSMLAQGTKHLYVFGTAGEGYAVTEQQFDEV